MAKTLATVALLVNAFTWGVSWWFFRNLQGLGVHPLWSTALVYVVCSVCVLLLFASTWRNFLRVPWLWLLVLAAGFTNVGFNWAVTVGDVVRVVLLFYLMPAWVVLLAWPVLGEKPSGWSLGRLALALLGLVIILKTPDTPWPPPKGLADGLADGLALVAGFFFALSNVLLRKLKSAPVSASVLAMFSGGAVMSALVAALGVSQGLVQPLPAPALAWLLWVLALSVFFMGSNFALQYGAARLRSSTASVIMLSEVVFASVSAIFLGASQMHPKIWIGGSLIVLAAFFSACASDKESL